MSIETLTHDIMCNKCDASAKTLRDLGVTNGADIGLLHIQLEYVFGWELENGSLSPETTLEEFRKLVDEAKIHAMQGALTRPSKDWARGYLDNGITPHACRPYSYANQAPSRQQEQRRRTYG